MKTERTAKRPYRQRARAVAAVETANRILLAFFELLRDRPYDEVTLDAVSRRAGVTSQTVIRRFGGKEGLLEATIARMGSEIRARRTTPPGDLEAAVDAVVRDYETTGDFILRMLAQEDRFPAVRHMIDVGRAGHRDWVAQVSLPLLAGTPPSQRRERVDGLVVALDVYTWKILRRDMGRSVTATTTLMLRLARGILNEYEE